MPVIQQEVTKQYVANGGTTSFAYPFYIKYDSWLKVYVGDVLQTINVHYTVTGVDSINGGNAVFISPPSNGSLVTVTRKTPIERLVDYQTNGPYKANVVNVDFSTLYYIVQEQDSRINKVVKLPITSPFVGDLTIPNPTPDTFLAWNGTGTALVNVSITGTGAVVDATTTLKGITRYSTTLETQGLAHASSAVTPAGLGALVASTSQRGIIAVASPAEVTAGTDNTKAITPQALATSGFTAGDPLFQYLYFGS